MASGHPKFGGALGVVALDLGQAGGTRAATSVARATIRVVTGDDEFAVADHHLPAQNVTFRDVLGYQGRTIVWECVLRFINAVMFQSVVSELNRYLHGSVRFTGVLGPPSPSQIRPTLITDSDGTAMGNAALIAWRLTGRRMTSAEWPVIVRAVVTFRGVN